MAYADLPALRTSVHRWGGTVNAAIVAAVVTALARLLEARGERPGEIAVAVPVAVRSADSARELGNLVTPITITVPAHGDRAARVRHVTEEVRRRRPAPGVRPPAALLGGLFRAAGPSARSSRSG